jgi:signal transduction histidine kinase
MAAEGGASERGPWAARRSVRVRTTSVAVIVVALTLIAAGAATVWWLDRSLTQSVERTAHVTAERAADVLAMQDAPEGVSSLPISSPEDEFVQVIDPDGTVVASSANVAGRPAFAVLRAGETERIEVGIGEDEDDLDEEEPFLAVGVGDDGNVIVAGRTLESVEESVDVLVGLLIVGLPLLLLVLGLVVWRVVGRALEPVESIRREVESISTEELHRRVPVPGAGDEIGRLAGTMNEMLKRLEVGQERQRRFVSDASHELRSPVASIRQHAEVAIAHPGSARADDLARVVLEEDLRLQRLVEDLLLLARMDERDNVGVAGAVDLDDVVFAEVARARAGTAKEIDTSRVSAGRVEGDSRALGRLVANLLENAIRHATRKVDVSLAEDGDEVVLRVDDDGGGVAEADRERIFDRFIRLEEARDRDSGGSGLGLAIVAEVADRHDATVEVGESSAGGSRFEVRFPRSE